MSGVGGGRRTPDVRGGSRAASLGRSRPLQHRGGRLRQTSGRQARDGLRGLPRQPARGPMGRAARPRQPRRQRPRGPRRRARGPGRDLCSRLTGDGGLLPRHLEARRASCCRSRSCTATRDSAPAQGLRAASARHRFGERRAHAGRSRRRDPRARRRPARRRRRPVRHRRIRGPTIRRSSITRRAPPGSRRASSTPTATSSATRNSRTATR